MKFGNNLRQIRKSKKISQEKLAEMMNVTRQSISKWENGESYPEMNKILELCKILNCKLNDLVHTDMSDKIPEGDFAVNKVKFNEKKQNEMKGISNVIKTIAKISSIVLKVAIPFIVLIIMLVPYVISNVDVKNNEIIFSTDKIKLTNENEIEIHNVVIGQFDNDLSKDEIIKIVQNNSKIKMISYIEIALIFLLIEIIIIIMILSYVEKLFNNVKENITPFILDNVKFIKQISYLLVLLIVVNYVSTLLFSTIAGVSNENNSPIDLMNILEILIIYSMSYIFEYGYELQKESK